MNCVRLIGCGLCCCFVLFGCVRVFGFVVCCVYGERMCLWWCFLVVVFLGIEVWFL